ncbi:hypothetical protein SLEP1_g44861 [Rubroshorea leprosula]|uniref:DUF4283 domain-containing protein n=1 Tax=Rubroshorea leprosula TaxID=152421 RepID=A0AAV5LHX6_9ROSI|nr:hypothetical protein SLEP1_g44861 [Rubroshorea leprosula]
MHPMEGGYGSGNQSISSITSWGLPAHAWKSKTFQTCRNVWGNFITLDDSTSGKRRFDAARFLIIAPSSESIFKSIIVKINGEFYTLKFTEEESTNNLFSMRSDRAFHVPDEEEDEESWSQGSSNDGDLSFDVEKMEQVKIQALEAEGGDNQNMFENEVVLSNDVDGIGNELAFQVDEVEANKDEPKHNSKKYAEMDGTNTENGNNTEDSDIQLEGSDEQISKIQS